MSGFRIPPIPIEAWPVVEVLRRDVPRPETPPVMVSCCPRWYQDIDMRGRETCPMGMHPMARALLPADNIDFPLAEDAAVKAFARWFDCLPAKAAPFVVDAIWGPEVKP